MANITEAALRVRLEQLEKERDELRAELEQRKLACEKAQEIINAVMQYRAMDTEDMQNLVRHYKCHQSPTAWETLQNQRDILELNLQACKVHVKKAEAALRAAQEQEPGNSDMAEVGRSLLKAISANAYPGWSPAECPSEIVGDMRNDIDNLRSALEKLRYALDPTEDWIGEITMCGFIDDALAGKYAAPIPQEPVGYQYRTRFPLSAPWGDWKSVCHKPQGPEDLSFQIRPVFAASPTPQQAVQEVDCDTCANHGRINGLTQDTFCRVCIWQEQYRTDNYKAAAQYIVHQYCNSTQHPIPDGMVLVPRKETEAMHDAVMSLLYKGMGRGDTQALLDAYIAAAQAEGDSNGKA